MKVVILIDSFKGSMTSMEAGYAVCDGILRVKPKAQIIVKPLADGGEGTTDVLIDGVGGKKITINVTGPMNNRVQASYGILNDRKTAIIEMAQSSGITLIPNKKNPLEATTFGVGEMIKDAITKGCSKFIIGIGGSATNDGGIGMLQALGVQFFTSSGQLTGEGAQALEKIADISLKNLIPQLKNCEFQIACDVNNPLYGTNGATYIYGTQKGVSGQLFERIENGMINYAHITNNIFGKDLSNVSGTGAAGGLGFAFLSFLNAKLVPGIELILNTINIDKELLDTDIVITGEGKIDAQTAMGKAPIGVAKYAKKYNCTVIAFAGSVTQDAYKCNELGIDAFFPIVRGVTTLKESMETRTSKQNLTDAVEQVFRLL